MCNPSFGSYSPGSDSLCGSDSLFGSDVPETAAKPCANDVGELDSQTSVLEQTGSTRISISSSPSSTAVSSPICGRNTGTALSAGQKPERLFKDTQRLVSQLWGGDSPAETQAFSDSLARDWNWNVEIQQEETRKYPQIEWKLCQTEDDVECFINNKLTGGIHVCTSGYCGLTTNVEERLTGETPLWMMEDPEMPTRAKSEPHMKQWKHMVILFVAEGPQVGQLEKRMIGRFAHVDSLQNVNPGGEGVQNMPTCFTLLTIHLMRRLRFGKRLESVAL